MLASRNDEPMTDTPDSSAAPAGSGDGRSKPLTITGILFVVAGIGALAATLAARLFATVTGDYASTINRFLTLVAAAIIVPVLVRRTAR